MIKFVYSVSTVCRYYLDRGARPSLRLRGHVAARQQPGELHEDGGGGGTDRASQV